MQPAEDYRVNQLMFLCWYFACPGSELHYGHHSIVLPVLVTLVVPITFRLRYMHGSL